MQARTQWIAAGASVAVALSLSLFGTRDAPPKMRDADAMTARAVDVVRVAGDVSVVGELRPITLDAARARTAMRDGVLRIALPDGTTYPVRMERQETDGFGQWSVFGRVDTAAGVQSAVLTFGGDAVFGTLPMPDGHALQIVTNHGRVLASRAGGLMPSGRGTLADTATRSRKDMVAKRREATRSASAQGTTFDATLTRAVAAASPPTAQALQAAAAPPVPTQVLTPSGGVQALAGPITISVLGVYTDDLVALRGSESAVQTELSNKVAASTQAHIASASIVRFSLVATKRVDIPAWVPNDEVLYAITAGPILGIDFERLRDTASADVVAIVRPHTTEHIECGIAWVGGNGLYGTDTEALFGYAVVNTEPCGPHVMAHELGHVLGAAHDRETDYAGLEVRQASYAFSFGHRRDGKFATIMAYDDGAPWLGFFANPAFATACAGERCGEADRSDNVRGFNLMAKTVSEFRSAPGKATISDVGAWEGGTLNFHVRLNGVPPVEGAQFTYDLDLGTGFNPGGGFPVYESGEGLVSINLFNDDDVKAPDRPIRVRIASTNYPIADNVAIGTFYNDDPRPKVHVRVRAADGAPLYGTPYVYGRNGPRDEPGGGDGSEFDVAVAPGSNLEVFPQKDLERGLASKPIVLNEVRRDTDLDILLPRGVLVRGDASPQSLYFRESLEDRVLDEPEYKVTWGADWPRLVYPGATIHLYEDSNLPWFGVLQGIRKPVTFAMPSARKKAIMVHSVDSVQEGRAARPIRIPVLIELVQPLLYTDPVTVTWRTVDGTAKRDVDYRAASGKVTLTQDLPYKTVFVELIGDAHAEGDEYFNVAIDPVADHLNSVPSWRVQIRDDDLRPGGPQPKSRVN